MAPLLHPGNQQHCPPFGFCSYLVIDTLRRLCEWFFVNKVDFLMTHYIITCILCHTLFWHIYDFLVTYYALKFSFDFLGLQLIQINEDIYMYIYIVLLLVSCYLYAFYLVENRHTTYILLLVCTFSPTHCALFKIPWCTILRYLCYPLWHTLQMDRASADTNTPQIGSVSKNSHSCFCDKLYILRLFVTFSVPTILWFYCTKSYLT